MKRFFSPEERPENLRDLLNALLGPDRKIKTLRPLGTEKVAASVAVKTVIYDLACEDEHGNVFVVEVQRVSHAELRERLVYYGARQVGRLMARGQRTRIRTWWSSPSSTSRSEASGILSTASGSVAKTGNSGPRSCRLRS